MWWKEPIRKPFRPLLSQELLEVVVRCYCLVEVGGFSAKGPERGRKFEKAFYMMCSRRGFHLCERAGSRTLAEQRSASGFMHEVDAGTRSLRNITAWELKHLSTTLDKNELLVFNGKTLDFLQGSSPAIARIPLLRFLMSGNNVRDESRYFGALWGINIIEPHRIPLALLYEAVARGGAAVLKPNDRDVIQNVVRWACRPLQNVVSELAASYSAEALRRTFNVTRSSRIAVDVQEQIGKDIEAFLDEHFPDWVDDAAERTWREIGGW